MFAPERSAMYPPDADIRVELPRLSADLEGWSRPHFFAGVALIVTKLLNIVRPDAIYMGQKDFQQTVVIRRLAAELFIPTEVIVCPTVREPDGLAMSSRNAYLSAGERATAPALYAAMMAVRDKAGSLSVAEAVALLRSEIEATGAFRIDYTEIRAADTLRPVQALVPEAKPVMLIAAWLGRTRLIDNLPVFDNVL
jgi:pantoate--beta-alanine ligase